MIYVYYYRFSGSVAQWLVRRSLVGRLALACDRPVIDR